MILHEMLYILMHSHTYIHTILLIGIATYTASMGMDVLPYFGPSSHEISVASF